tara:strand:- start:1061 stop:1537 length:477 start_codon:yes stop_codon:yes gene_type:complete
MKRTIPAILLFSFLINSSLTYSSNFKTKEITWSELRKLNYKTGEMPESLSLLVGQSIKIPGFAVPLEGDDGFEYIDEFLLVPYFGACIHVPPPPPNQVIHVILNEPVYFEVISFAIWITGILEIGDYFIEGGSDDYGQMRYDTETNYLIRGLSVKEYD